MIRSVGTREKVKSIYDMTHFGCQLIFLFVLNSGLAGLAMLGIGHTAIVYGHDIRRSYCTRRVLDIIQSHTSLPDLLPYCTLALYTPIYCHLL